MLPRQDNKIDIDGYATMVLSTLFITATAGLSYLHNLRKILNTAKNETPVCEKDVMVFVLGKKLKNDNPDLEYQGRLKRAHAILEKDAESQVIILGGKTGNATITEAHAGKDFLQKYNIDASRIYLEQSSRNTLENIHNALELLETKNKKIVVVTNRYHLARAKQMANGFGLNVDLCAAEEKFDKGLISILKIMIEAFHLHWYKTGRYYARLTNNQRMLKRIGKY